MKDIVFFIILLMNSNFIFFFDVYIIVDKFIYFKVEKKDVNFDFILMRKISWLNFIKLIFLFINMVCLIV